MPWCGGEGAAGPLCPCPPDLSTRVHTGLPASCRACRSSPEGLLLLLELTLSPAQQATMPQNEGNEHADGGWEPGCTRKYLGSLPCGAASLWGAFCTGSPSVPSGVTLRSAPLVAWKPTLSLRPSLPRLTFLKLHWWLGGRSERLSALGPLTQFAFRDTQTRTALDGRRTPPCDQEDLWNCIRERQEEGIRVCEGRGSILTGVNATCLLLQ